MSNEKIPLLALKGQVTVHFLDGNTLDGEFSTQDSLNIFLTVNEAPVMIPRSQIRFIQGRAGQTIDVDMVLTKSGARWTTDTLARGSDTPTQYPTAEGEDEEDVTLLLPADEAADEVTVLLPAGAAEEVSDLHEEDDATVWIEEIDDKDSTLVVPDEVAAGESMAAYLECTTGPHAGERFDLQSGVITLGRSTDNIFILAKDKEISRRHATITYKDGQFFIQDRGSLNGVIINDVRIEGAQALQAGDRILLGVSTLIFHEA